MRDRRGRLFPGPYVLEKDGGAWRLQRRSERPLPDARAASIRIASVDAAAAVSAFAKGEVQLRKLLSKGDVHGFSAALPMSVVLGNADMMSVQIRGVNFDLTASTKDKVARFEVK